jgi:hypothetical protein
LGTSVSGPNLNGISLIKGVFMTCRIVSVYFFADEQSLSKYAPYAVMEAAIPATRVYQYGEGDESACKGLDKEVNKAMRELIKDGGDPPYFCTVVAGLPKEGEELSWQTIRIQPMPGLASLKNGNELITTYIMSSGENLVRPRTPSA